MQETIRIIGIDPGLRRTGWGIIETLGNSLRFVASGTVTSDGDMDLASRLCQLHDGLLHGVRRIFRNTQTGAGGHQHGDAARLAELQRRRRILVDEGLLDSRLMGLVAVHDLGKPIVQLAKA